jgi:hypothetical protein
MEFLKDPSEDLGWKKIVHEAEKGGSDQLMGGDAVDAIEPSGDGGPLGATALKSGASKARL